MFWKTSWTVAITTECYKTTAGETCEKTLIHLFYWCSALYLLYLLRPCSPISDLRKAHQLKKMHEIFPRHLKTKKKSMLLVFFSPSLVSLASARIIISDGGPDFCRGFKRLDGFCSHIKKANPVSSFTASWHESSRLCSPTPCFVLKRTPREDEWDQLISCWRGRAATPGIPAEPVKTQRFADGADMSADLRQPVSHGSRVCTTCR